MAEVPAIQASAEIPYGGGQGEAPPIIENLVMAASCVVGWDEESSRDARVKRVFFVFSASGHGLPQLDLLRLSISIDPLLTLQPLVMVTSFYITRASCMRDTYTNMWRPTREVARGLSSCPPY
jgi:hypothetical protein